LNRGWGEPGIRCFPFACSGGSGSQIAEGAMRWVSENTHLALRHRFRGARDDGLPHSLAKQLVRLLQLLLRVVLSPPVVPKPRTPVCCPHRGAAMTILAVRAKHQPLLC